MAKLTLEFNWDEFATSHVACRSITRAEHNHYLVMCDYDEQTFIKGSVYHNIEDAMNMLNILEHQKQDENMIYYILKIRSNGEKERIIYSSCINGDDFDID